MAQNQIVAESALEIDRLATQLAKDPHSKVFMPLAEEYGKAGMWQEAAAVLEDGLKLYPGFITAMVALGRAYDHLGHITKSKAILEESVKLSPENLRAHRTLMKIYAGQGLNDSALQSCAVILAVNPRDEEALAAQSALGGPLKQPKGKEVLQPKYDATDTRNRSAQPATVQLASVELTASGQEMNTVQDSLVPQHQVSSVLEPGHDLQAADTAGTPSPSSHAEIVAQLETWLCTIDSRRHNRDSKTEPHP
jgi:tetratricopeptide (TPR) repeat protein